MDIIALKAFTLVLEESSFSAAARRMGLSRAMVSKHIASLEAHLGTRLLTRSTRSVRPTELGLKYHARVSRILHELEEADEEIRAIASRPRGKLRIGAPISYMLRVLNVHVMRFMAEYPDIELDLVLDDCMSNPISEALDAVISIGTLPDSTLHARRIHSVHACLVASPDYVAEAGMPRQPADLLNHRCLHYSYLPGGDSWPLGRLDSLIHQRIRPAFSANNGDMLRAAALDGQGIAVVMRILVDEDLAAGRLVNVLPEYAVEDIPVHLVHTGRRHATGALLAFLEFLGRQNLDAATRDPARNGQG